MKVFSLLLILALTGQCKKDIAQPSITEEEITLTNGNVTLKGWLQIPSSTKPVPVVVFLSSSGNTLGKNAHYTYLAEKFTKAGIAVFMYDKRGVGQSTGSWQTSSYYDLTDDGLAAVQYLKTRKEIKKDAIGVWGISQGGWLCQLAASKSGDVGFLITVSGPTVGPEEQKLFQTGNQYRRQGLTEAEVLDALIYLKRLHSYLGNPVNYTEIKAATDSMKTLPYFGKVQWEGLGPGGILPGPSYIQAHPEIFSYFSGDAKYDPLPALNKIKVPMLAVFGGKDIDVPVDRCIQILNATMSAIGNTRVATHIFPDANHPMLVPDGNPYVENYAEVMRDWIVKNFK